MGQNFNTSAIYSTFTYCIKNQKLLIPSKVIKNITEINYKNLHSQGYKYIAFDKDNTLTAPYKLNIHCEYKQAWKECINVFGKDNIVIVSNSTGSGDKKFNSEIAVVEKALGVKVLKHKLKKPLGGGDLLSHFNLPNTIQNQQPLIVVGDRLLTDVVYGNLIGAKTFLVSDIVTKENDNSLAVIIRWVEKNWIIKFLKWRYPAMF